MNAIYPPQPNHPQTNSQAPAPPLPLEMWGATDKGREREGNEDYIYPHSGADTFAWQPGLQQLAQKGHLLIVADGVGGAQAGREASSSVAKVVAERYYELAGPAPDDDLRVAIQEANTSLYQQVTTRTSLQGAGTTVAAAVIRGNYLYIANVGDSRVYLIRDGQAYQQTIDHTLTQRKIDQGIIKREEAELDPDRSVLTRSMGAGPTVQVDLFPPLQLTAGDIVLLCSDGLTDMLDDGDIARLAQGSSPRRAARRLIAAANGRGGFDNISVVMARVGGRKAPAGGGLLGGLRRLAGGVRAMKPRQRTVLLMGTILVVIALCALAVLGWQMSGGARRTPTPVPPPTATTEAPPVETTPAVATDTPRPADTVQPGALTPTLAPTVTPRPTFTPTPTPVPPPPDGDGDGVPDSRDQCPEEFGLSQCDGCPDTDGDGICDRDDLCRDEFGPPEFNGCPDSDSDGVHDGIDQCREVPGPPENGGCPPREGGDDGGGDNGGGDGDEGGPNPEDEK